MVKHRKNNKSQYAQTPYYCNKQKGKRRVYNDSENLNHTKQVALARLSDVCLNFKPESKGSKKSAKKERKALEDTFHCKTIDLPQSIRDQFVSMNHNLLRDISNRNDYSPLHYPPNVRRLELLSTYKLFRDLSRSRNAQDKLFTIMLCDALYIDYYTIRGYLTWSTYHSLSCPSVTKLRVGNRNNSRYEVFPQKICFFSLEKIQDYYLQLRNLNQHGHLQAPHLCRIVTNKMCIFNGDVIHSD